MTILTTKNEKCEIYFGVEGRLERNNGKISCFSYSGSPFFIDVDTVECILDTNKDDIYRLNSKINNLNNY